MSDLKDTRRVQILKSLNKSGTTEEVKARSIEPLLKIWEIADRTNWTEEDKKATLDMMIQSEFKTIKPLTREEEKGLQDLARFMAHTIIPERPIEESIMKLLKELKEIKERNHLPQPIREQLINEAFKRVPKEALQTFLEIMTEKNSQREIFSMLQKDMPSEIVMRQLSQAERDFCKIVKEIIEDAKTINRHIDYSDFTADSEKINSALFKEDIRKAMPDDFITRNWSRQSLTFIKNIKTAIEQ